MFRGCELRKNLRKVKKFLDFCIDEFTKNFVHDFVTKMLVFVAIFSNLHFNFFSKHNKFQYIVNNT